jgi:hypothetical protein
LTRENLKRQKNLANFERKDYPAIKRLNQENEYILEIERREKELQKDFKYYDDLKIKYEIQIRAKEQELELMSYELRSLQDNLTVLQNKQITYYSDLLKAGIDVRLEGLTWIVRNLIELNAILENSIFPKFLENSHIEYLTVQSKKGVEIMQLEIMKRCLKNNLINKQTYNELSYISSPSRKFKTPKTTKKEPTVDVFRLLNYEGLKDEDNVLIYI